MPAQSPLSWLLFTAAVVSAKYNVIHIVIDDLRPELGCYGLPNRSTPIIDKFAAGGTVFDSAYCNIGVCGPSRNSFMSGRRPDASRSWNFLNSFREDHPEWTSLPGVFLANGALALGSGKLYHPKMPPAYDGNLSWSDFDNNLPYKNPCWNTADYARSSSCENGKAASATCDGGLPCIPCLIDVENQLGINKNVSVENEFCTTDAFEDTMSVRHAIDLLRAAVKSGKQFYLGVGMHKPHLPWQFAEEDLNKHPLESVDSPLHTTPNADVPEIALTYSDSTADKGAHTSPFIPISEKSAKIARRSYRAAVTGMDRKLGLLYDEIEKLGLTNNTAVVLHSDHGWHLGEHGLWRKATNFESVARIPMLIRAPWIKNPPARSDALVELVDIMPTIIELAGFENPPGETIDGVSVVPLMSAPSSAATKEYVYSQYPRIARHPDRLWDSNNPIHNPRETFTHMGYSIRSKEYRYTEWLEWNKTALLPIWDKLVGTELYDHRGIPTYPTDYNAYENKNYAGDQSYATVQKELSAVLRKHFPSPADGPIEPPRCIPDGQCRTASTQYECCTGDHFSTLNCGIYGRCGCRLSGECAEKESDCCSGASHYTLACPGLQRCQGF